MLSIPDEQTLKSIPMLYDQIKKLFRVAPEMLFKTSDFSATTMSELASVAGISEKIISAYFASKSEFIDFIIYKQIDTKEKELEQRVRMARNPIQEAFITWHIVDEFVRQFNINTLIEIQKSFQQTFKRIMAFKNEFLFRLFKSNVDRGITAGLYRNTIKSDIIAQYMADISFISGSSKVAGRAGLPPMEVDNQLLSYHLHGLATEKGVSLIRRYKNEALAQHSKYVDSINFRH